MRIINPNRGAVYSSLTRTSIPGNWKSSELNTLNIMLADFLKKLGSNKIILSDEERIQLNRILTLDKEGRAVKLVKPLTPAEEKQLRIKQEIEKRDAKRIADKAKHEEERAKKRLINSDSSFSTPDGKAVSANTKTVEAKELPEINQTTSLSDIMAHNKAIKNKNKGKNRVEKYADKSSEKPIDKPNNVDDTDKVDTVTDSTP